MTVYFENNSFKYEIEAVLKLFCPLESFEFEYDAPVPSEGDRTVVSVRNRLCIYVCLDGRECERSEALPINAKEYEISLCRLLYRALSEITGVSPKWGCLTGIRPVKKINALAREGLPKEEIFKRLRDKYFISPEKFELTYLTSVTQADALSSLDPKSYSLYISIPFCPTRCSYCSFVSHSIQSRGARELIPQYVDMLCREIEETGRILSGKNTHCDTVYIGGGTPTSLSAAELEKIMKTIQKSIDISEIREYTVEAGRADTITEEKLTAVRNNGATRISVNPQTMIDSVLKAVGRMHTAEQVEKCFALARRIGFKNINMDTIAGLPTDTLDGFKETIERLTELDPESITVHTLTVKRSAELFKSSEELKKHYLRDNCAAEMTDFAFEFLTKKGYAPYYLYRQKNTVGNLENAGYAKKGFESLYNIYIMEEAQNIIACGAGGSTKLVDSATGKITRYFNYKFPYEYISRYEKMTAYKPLLEDFLNQL